MKIIVFLILDFNKSFKEVYIFLFGKGGRRKWNVEEGKKREIRARKRF